MGQTNGQKPDAAIRREWLRKVKEMWEKRKWRKREKKSGSGAGVRANARLGAHPAP